MASRGVRLVALALLTTGLVACGDEGGDQTSPTEVTSSSSSAFEMLRTKVTTEPFEVVFARDGVDEFVLRQDRTRARWDFRPSEATQGLSILSEHQVNPDPATDLLSCYWFSLNGEDLRRINVACFAGGAAGVGQDLFAALNSPAVDSLEKEVAGASATCHTFVNAAPGTRDKGEEVCVNEAGVIVSFRLLVAGVLDEWIATRSSQANVVLPDVAPPSVTGFSEATEWAATDFGLPEELLSP